MTLWFWTEVSCKEHQRLCSAGRERAADQTDPWAEGVSTGFLKFLSAVFWSRPTLQSFLQADFQTKEDTMHWAKRHLQKCLASNDEIMNKGLWMEFYSTERCQMGNISDWQISFLWKLGKHYSDSYSHSISKSKCRQWQSSLRWRFPSEDCIRRFPRLQFGIWGSLPKAPRSLPNCR